MRRRTMPRPRPRLPPVTTTLRMLANHLAGRADVERRHEANRRGHLVRGEPLVAEAKNVGLVVRRRLAVDDDVGDDERSGDRAAPRPDAGHADGRVTGDHRLDLLGVHLLAADVDDAAPTTEEVVALTASLDDVAGIHEALVIAQGDVFAEVAAGGPRRANPQRTVLDLDLDGPGRADDARREAFEAIVDLEADARFRRRVGMADAGSGVEGAKGCEQRLVGDLARQTHVARRHRAGRRAHERATPVRRRAGNV